MSVRPILKGAQWVQSLSGENAEEQVEANKKQFVGNELEGKRLGGHRALVQLVRW